MKLLIFDGNSILNRAYYAIRALSTKDGRPTNGIFGFLKLYHKYFEISKPDMVAVEELFFNNNISFDGFSRQVIPASPRSR